MNKERAPVTKDEKSLEHELLLDVEMENHEEQLLRKDSSAHLTPFADNFESLPAVKSVVGAGKSQK